MMSKILVLQATRSVLDRVIWDPSAVRSIVVLMSAPQRRCTVQMPSFLARSIVQPTLVSRRLVENYVCLHLRYSVKSTLV